MNGREYIIDKLSKASELLISRSKDRRKQPRTTTHFTSDKKANALVSDLKNHPHAYTLACILDQQYIAEKVWAIPYEIKNRLGFFDIDRLAIVSRERIEEIFLEPTKLHRFPEKMAEAVFLAIQKIVEDYDGDARKIWSGKPSSSTIVRRFREFKYVGPKIATMATNILVRYFDISVTDYEAIDISADVHVQRVFGRIGFTAKNPEIDEVIQKARRLNPEYPGIYDAEIWHLGREICRPNDPLCPKCFLRNVCAFAGSSP